MSNLLLAQFSESARSKLLSRSETVYLKRGAIVHEALTPVTHAYFPLSAVISWVAEMHDDKRVEVYTFGRNGMGGIAAAFDGEQGSNRAIVQAQGESIRVPADHLKSVIGEEPQAGLVLFRYATGIMNSIAQSAACNRLHDLSERCAKWLLIMPDLSGVDELPIDQQLLADMLGARRQSVSVTTTMLQDAGFIARRRSCTIITDRAGLEGSACECYALMREENDTPGDQHLGARRTEAAQWFAQRRASRGEKT